MLNGFNIRIEHLCDIILKAQSWLVLNLPVSMFVYIHFNVPPISTTDLVRNVSDQSALIHGRRTFLYGKCHFSPGGGPLEIFQVCKFLVIPLLYE